MSTYQKAPAEVKEMAEAIMTEFLSYKPLIEAKVKIEFQYSVHTRTNLAQ